MENDFINKTQNCRRSFLKTVSRTLFSLPLIGLSGISELVKFADNFDTSSNDLLNYDNSLLLPKDIKHPPSKSLTLYNVNTGEWVKKCMFWEKGSFNPSALSSINYLLRDHRNHQIKKIDPNLIMQLHKMQELLEQNKTLHVVSGYRSKQSNELLRLRTGGVAKNSQHLYGKAIDIFIEGVSISNLHRAALKTSHGGVGKYSRFVHIDTGPRRRWTTSC